MLLNSINKVLLKCKVSHYILQSYLYNSKSKNSDVYASVSKNYPLPYYYIKKGYSTSFYFKKITLFRTIFIQIRKTILELYLCIII